MFTLFQVEHNFKIYFEVFTLPPSIVEYQEHDKRQLVFPFICLLISSSSTFYINSNHINSLIQVLELHKVVADLLISLMEESSPGALQVAKVLSSINPIACRL